MVDPARLAAWVAHVFDHPVTKPPWYQDVSAPGWDGPAREVVALMTEVFERPDAPLAPFTDDQLNQGLWYFLGVDGLAWTLTDAAVTMDERRRGLRSMVVFFERFLTPRCSGKLAHEAGGRPLDVGTYMWFDIIEWWIFDRTISPPDDEDPDPGWRHLDEATFRAEVFETLRAILAIPHDSCRESALHGLGHFRKWDAAAAASIIDDFLASTPGLRPELVTYAREAREGTIQ